MLSSDRRGSSARRGLQVLGKIPAVPKPINLPSQRLENRGLDPNVEIVPRGSLSWGSAGTSPSTSSNAWGSPAQASSPPSGSGVWGAKAGAGSGGSGGTLGGAASGSAGSIPRPGSGGGGARPQSAESVGQTQQAGESFGGSTNASSAWGARPSSASGVLGQAQPLLAQAQAQARPRSADISRPSRNLSEFGDESAESSPPGNASWATRRRLGEEGHQASRFQLTRTDFPTLGSEKNPDLRPQQSNSGADRGAGAEAKGGHGEERMALTSPPGPHEEIPARPRSAGYGHPERGGPENWRREAPAFQGPVPHGEGNWHRDGPSGRPAYGGQGPPPDSWRREGGPADENWRRGGAPPVGQYGSAPGPGHYPHEGPGFMHGPRFGPGPAHFGRGAGGPGGYGHHGEAYGNAGPLLRPGGPMHPMRPNMFQGPVPYEGFYGPPGPGYQGMEDPERMMMGMGGGPGPGPYGGYPPHRGPPPEAFGRFGHGGMKQQGPRHPREGSLRERGEVVGEGYHEGPNFHKEGGEGGGHKDGRGYGERFNGGAGGSHEVGENRRGGMVRGGGGGTDVRGHGHGGASGGHHGGQGHRDWGAAASSDEPMDFSKPVFEEEAGASSGGGSGKQSPVDAEEEEGASGGEVKREDVKADAGSEAKAEAEAKAEKSAGDAEAVKGEEKPVVGGGAANGGGEVSSAGKASAEGGDDVGGKDEGQSEAMRAAVEKEAVAEEVVAKEVVAKEVVAKEVVVKEVVAKIVTMEKLERGGRRGDGQGHGREAGGNAGCGSMRSGAHGGKSSVVRSVARNGGADVAGGAQGVPQSSEGKTEKTEAEAAKGSEKGRASRRPESPKVQGGGGEGEVPDGGASQAGAGQEMSGKEVSKAKGKVSSHDVEKEWRPKVAIAEASPRHHAGGAGQASKASGGGSGGAAEGAESKSSEPESGARGGSRADNMEAQRVSAKEKAAQKASRLAKEEEERVKEQKAKARAKLEELNRRSSGAAGGGGGGGGGGEGGGAAEVWKASGEVEEGQEGGEDVGVVEAEGAAQGGSTKRGGRNEHGKRERDRKAGGRKGVGEMDRGRVAVIGTMGGGPGASGGAILSTPVGVGVGTGAVTVPVAGVGGGGEGQGQQSSSQREGRHRGRPEKKQLVARVEEVERSVAGGGASGGVGAAGGSGGWSMESVGGQEGDSGSVGHVGANNTEVAGSLRKSKSSRTSRNRERPEAPVVLMPESIQFGDIVVSELHSTEFHISGSEQGADAGGGGWHGEAGKEASLSGDALTGDEGSAVSTNGDGPSKRLQRKGRGARRPGRSDRGGQDQRAAEKSHGIDNLVWAPVRSPGSAGGTKGEGPQSGYGQEEGSAAPQQTRGKRAEMERYTPKPLMKYQEASEQASGVPHQHTQGAQNPGSGGGNAAWAGEGGGVAGVAESKQSWAPASFGETRGNQEAKAVDGGSKGGRSHGSWRQRGPGGEREGSGVESAGSGHGDAGQQHVQRQDQKHGGGGGASGRRNQSGSEQGMGAGAQTTAVGGGSGPSASGGANTGSAPVGGGGRGPAGGGAAASEREHPADKKLYQAPRPASVSGQRGQDYRGQGPYGSEHKGQEQGTGAHPRQANAGADRAVASESAGSQQQRNSGGHHPRNQSAEKEPAPSQQVYLTPHAQQKSGGLKESSQAVYREREGQQQQGSRGASQHGGEGGEQGPYNSHSHSGSNSSRGRAERDQAARPSSGAQRGGQGQWQQTGDSEGFRSGASRTHGPERDGGAGREGSRMEASKQQAAEAQRGQQSEQSGQQQSKGGQQAGAVAIPSAKGESGGWGGDGGSPPVGRGRDYNQGRRGRFGGRSGPRSAEMEHRRDPPAAKQRLVIDATGGAVPSQVGG